MNMTGEQRYAQRLEAQRIFDDKTAALAKSVQTDKMLRENFSSDDRVVQRRIGRQAKQVAADTYATRRMAEAAAAQEREALMLAQDEALAQELARRNVEKVRHQKNVQRVVEQSEELRDLEAKLKVAYMNKERDVQILEAAKLVEQQRTDDARVAEEMEKDRQRGLKAEAYRAYLRTQDGVLMRQELDAQMIEKEERKKLAYEEFLKEKSMVDEVVERILAEDAAEKHAREAKEAEIRADIADFVATSEKMKEGRMKIIEAENKEIRAYAQVRLPRAIRRNSSSAQFSDPAPLTAPPTNPSQMVMQRETELRMQRESEQNKKDAILERLSSDMAKAQREADELENLRNELVVQETEERIIQKEKEKFERTVQQRLDIALANEYQRQLKSIRREEEKKEEDEFRLAMMKKFEEDDRLDELNARKRREKQMEHRREIERLLEKRREAYEAERARGLEEKALEERHAALRTQIIEEERRRMIANHAKNLGLQHLPRGILENADDLALFKANEGFKPDAI